MIVLWRITERCNLSCPFCAYDSQLSWSRKEADIGSVQRFGAVLSEYQRTSGDHVLVSWIGGEPFLFRELKQLTVLFKKHLDLRVSATTNGTTLRSVEVREHIIAHYDELTISVDGIGSLHDELRGWTGGFESLRHSVLQLAEMKRERQRGPRLRANVVLLRRTIRNFEQLCVELATWGIEEITFNQLGGRDRPEFFPANRLLPADAVRLTQDIPILRERLAKLGVTLNGGNEYLMRIQASSANQKIATSDCKPGQRLLFVNEQGIASPCHFTSEGYGIPIADLHSAQRLTELPQRFARLQKENSQAVCLDCHSTHVFSKFAA